MNHKKFVPSQQVSLTGTIVEPEHFAPPASSVGHYQPTKYEPSGGHYHSVPISKPTWKPATTSEVTAEPILHHHQHYQPYPSYAETDSGPPTESGKWYWMPNAKEPEATPRPVPPSYDGWKWVFDGKNKEAVAAPPSNSIHHQHESIAAAGGGTFDAFKTYHYLPEPHPYSFESAIPPTGPPTDTTFSYNHNKPAAVDESSAAPSAIPESEWANYWLKGAGKGEELTAEEASGKQKKKKEEKRKGYERAAVGLNII